MFYKEVTWSFRFLFDSQSIHETKSRDCTDSRDTLPASQNNGANQQSWAKTNQNRLRQLAASIWIRLIQCLTDLVDNKVASNNYEQAFGPENTFIN